MKTVMIFEQFTEPLAFIVADGDYRRLHRVFINEAEDEAGETLQVELSDFLYDAAGKTKVEMLSEFPVQAVLDGAFVIICGFLP